MTLLHITSTAIIILLHITKSYTLKQQESISIVFAGDISFAPPIRTSHGAACRYNDIFKHVAKYFKQADYSMVNLESTVCKRNMKNKAEFGKKCKFIVLYKLLGA